MILLILLFNLYLGVNITEKTAGNSFQNDWGVDISAKLTESRIEYSNARINGVENYSVITNLVTGKKGFYTLTNITDRGALDLYREDLTLGGMVKIKEVKNYFTGGMCFDKYREYKPCFRYGLFFLNSIQPHTGNSIADALLSGFVVKYTYTVRAECLLAKDRYQYGLSTENEFFLTKVLGISIDGFYGRYNNIEFHSGTTNIFFNF